MTADEAVVAVIDTLEAVGIRSMIVGSLAPNFHGIPRSTRDADFEAWAAVHGTLGLLEEIRRTVPPGTE